MIRLILALLLFGLCAAFGYAYHTQYFKWRKCFNDMGRCFDADTGTVYLQQSGAIWLLLAALTLGAALYHVWRYLGR